MLKYAYTIIYVKDVEKTVAFYKKAFGFDLKFITPEKDYAELISGQITISFASLVLADSNFKGGIPSPNKSDGPTSVQLSFTSNNIESDFRKAIENGATILSDLKTKPWGQTVGYVLDCNNTLIEICTSINK